MRLNLEEEYFLALRDITQHKILYKTIKLIILCKKEFKCED